MAPVVLQMDVHCYGCGKKIRKALEKIPGVESVTSSFETNQVVVMGTANAEELKTRLEIKMRKSVTILSYGVDEPPTPSRRAPSPPPLTLTPPTSPPRCYSRLPTSPPRYSRLSTSPPNYPPPTFAPDYPPPPRPQNYYDYYYPYGPNDSLALFSDENPNACSIQ